jgi:glycosyltransferase involved in cell wall biosynthesis
MTIKRLKIAYVTSLDARNKHSWSGIHYSIWQALQKNVGDVELIGPIKPFFALWIGKITTGLSQKLFHKRYNYRHSRLLAKAYAKVVNKQLQKNKYDLIVVPATSTFIPYLKTNAPIAYIGDSTVQNSMDYYPALSNLWGFSRKETISLEQAALNKSSLLTYPSKWASNSAIHDFDIPPSKVFTIPFGANLENIPDRDKVLVEKGNKICNLLFLGVDWNRKGGAIAFDTLIELNKIGIDAHLTVCGCVPPEEFHHTKLTIIPFLDKNNEYQKEKFETMFLNSNFLILPTRMECFGIVFCEASAFGIPSITADTGGVSSAVKDGTNGFLLPLSATGKDYARIIADIFTNEDKYNLLAKEARNLFEATINWDKWAESFKAAYLKIISESKKASV